MLRVSACVLNNMGVFFADTGKIIQRVPSLCEACLLTHNVSVVYSVTYVCDASVLPQI
jgi:hypothetical protein